MKISDIHQQGNAMQYVNQANSTNPSDPSQAPAEAKDRSSSPSQDKVEFSAQSREMQKVYDTLQTIPEVRTEKIAALKKSIEDGTYHVDNEDLAEKMIKASILDFVK
jgi:negative regulator of flagellin synthesis FlgM